MRNSLKLLIFVLLSCSCSVYAQQQGLGQIVSDFISDIQLSIVFSASVILSVMAVIAAFRWMSFLFTTRLNHCFNNERERRKTYVRRTYYKPPN